MLRTAGDVTESLKQTAKLMAQEIERSALNATTLGTSLKFGKYNVELGRGIVEIVEKNSR